MRLSPIGASFYSANRTVFRGGPTKPQEVQSTSLTEEAKKDSGAVMQKLLERTKNYGKKLAAFDFYKAEIKRTSAPDYTSADYCIKSVDTNRRDDIAGAIFEIAVNSDLPKADKLTLLQRIVGEDQVLVGSRLDGPPIDDFDEYNVSVKQMLNLHGYFEEKGKDLDKVAKGLGATEKLSPHKDFNPADNMTRGKVTYYY